jgi:hypothetical protein
MAFLDLNSLIQLKLNPIRIRIHKTVVSNTTAPFVKDVFIGIWIPFFVRDGPRMMLNADPDNKNKSIIFSQSESDLFLTFELYSVPIKVSITQKSASNLFYFERIRKTPLFL